MESNRQDLRDIIARLKAAPSANPGSIGIKLADIPVGLDAGMDPFTALTYKNGSLLVNAELVSFYWGNFTQSDIDAMQGYLGSLAAYLSGAGAPLGQIPTIWQYNCGCAHLSAVHLEINPPAFIDDEQLKRKIVGLQLIGQLPQFSANRLFLIFTKGIDFDKYNQRVKGGWCGKHSAFGTNEFWALCPMPPEGGVCGSGMDGWGSITSHEIMEAFTDPFPGTGWTVPGMPSDEGGDLCAWKDDNLGFGTVQYYADNIKRNCSLWTYRNFFNVNSFSPWQGYAVTNGLWLPGDFNRDGHTDILHVVSDSEGVNTWFSRGDGTFDVRSFSPWSGYKVINGQWIVGDYNGDRASDVVHAVDHSEGVNSWFSRGDGTYDVKPFSPWQGYIVTNGQWLAGDFTGDAKSDILHVVDNSDGVNVWLSNGDGTYNVKPFSPWGGYAVPNGKWYIGDFNGDFKADIVHAVDGTDGVNVWLSNGDGTFNVKNFNPWPGYIVPNGDWLIGDFNGDGKADIFHPVDNSDRVHVWLSNGDGTFDVRTFSPWPGYAIPNGTWIAGDWNRDGKTDILHAVDGEDNANIWISKGDGTFEVTPFQPWSGYATPNGLWIPGDYFGTRQTGIVHAVEDSSGVNVWNFGKVQFSCGG